MDAKERKQRVDDLLNAKQLSSDEIEFLKDYVGSLEAENEKALSENRYVMNFISHTTHELKSPLNSIMGSMKLIVDDLAEDRDEEIRYIQSAYSASEHLLGIIDDILDMSRLEAGILKLDIRDTELLILCEDVRLLTFEMANQKGIELILDVDAVSKLPPVNADYHRTKQVLSNLVFNSIKFTLHGSIRIKAEQMGDMVAISVIDTGLGVAPENLDKIFEPFVQAEEGTSKEYGGTGLGLTICKKFVEAMGGTIRMESEGIGKGTTTTFTLPISKEASNE